jgi:predicted O-methyltransferase YrrM
VLEGVLVASIFVHDLFDVVFRSSGIRNPHDEFKLEQSDLFTAEKTRRTRSPCVSCNFVIRLARVRRVLEIGAFIGLSTMYFAKAVPADGEAVSIEKFEKFAKIARRNFELNGLSSKIKMLTAIPSTSSTGCRAISCSISSSSTATRNVIRIT